MLKRSALPARGPSQTTRPRPPATQRSSASQVWGGSGGGSRSTIAWAASHETVPSASTSITSGSKRALPAFASAAGAIACTKSPAVRAAGLAAATITFAAAPTSTVNERMLSASRSSGPSMSTRPCRVPGSRPETSKSTDTGPASFQSTGLMARRTYFPSRPSTSTATAREASGPTRAADTVTASDVPAEIRSPERSRASMAKFRGRSADTSMNSTGGSPAPGSGCGAALSQAPCEQSVNT